MSREPLVRLGQGDYERCVHAEAIDGLPWLLTFVILVLLFSLFMSAGGPAAPRPTTSAPGAFPGAHAVQRDPSELNAPAGGTQPGS